MAILDIRQSKSMDENLENILKQCLVVDIETSSHYSDGSEVNLKTNFDDYVKYAVVKWVGLFSFRNNQLYTFNHNEPQAELLNLIASHSILVGHNLIDFDYPILKNNEFFDENDKHVLVDTMVVLGKSSFFTKQGVPYKNKGTLMDKDFSSNSLRSMAEEMGVETQKGDIDYTVFHQNTWTEEQSKEIITYLTSDIMATKQIFDKLWVYWKPFTQFLPFNSVCDLSWIRGSIASVIYKAACHILGEEPTYADKAEDVDVTEEKGGNVILPRVEEANDVWIIDVVSLYPHLFCLFNLCSEVSADLKGPYIWHGNDVFKVKGYYETGRPHPLSKMIMDMLKKRIELKKTDPTNPMVYTYKIFVNGFYGVVRSKIFEKVHKASAGWDCCDLGQQVQKIMETKMKEFGFETIAGDTDAIHVRAMEAKFNNEEYVKECLKKIVDYILSYTPFKVETFNIAIEKKTDYILYPWESQPVIGEDGNNIKIKNRLVKERKALKKNYLYIWTDKESKKQIEVKGFQIIKNNATKLGYEIFNNVLKTKIIEQGKAKFSKLVIDEIIIDYLTKPNAFDSISQEYRVKPAASYKKENQIQGQISRAYFGGGSGVIRLIKNNLVGKVGVGRTKYCDLNEAKTNNLKVDNLNLDKLYTEMAPFIKYEETDNR